ncbi:MAG TPA: L-rhamnose mutarotase [Gaiellales bacterium]|jgi:L-rhamnose mutarotase
MPEHVGLHTRLRPGAEAAYDELHRAVWPEVLALIRRAGVTSWMIYRDGLEIFHAIECDDYEAAIAQLASEPANRRWQAEVAPLMETAHDHSGGSSDRLSLIFELP